MLKNKKKEKTENLYLSGHPISSGLAIGKAFIYQDILQREHELYEISKNNVNNEMSRIKQAINAVVNDLELTANRVEKELKKDSADIFQAQKAVLVDPTLLEEIKKELAAELVNGEQVIKRVFRRWERKFIEMEEEIYKQRAEDIADIGRRVLLELTGIHAHALENVPEGSILVAKRLLPSDTVFLSRQTTAGVVLELGGSGSHAALLTRQMGIPAISCIPKPFEKIDPEENLIVDGFTGTVILNPDQKTTEGFKNRIEQKTITLKKQKEKCFEPAITLDSVTIEVMANVGCFEDVKHANENGADGIGLYRIEQLYLSRKRPPTEYEIMEEIGRSLSPLAKNKPATIRLLDIGGDKEVPFLDMPSEPNPFLGRRGVRLLLDYPDLAKTQLRALLRLSEDFKIEILVPMVTLAKEMHLIRQLLLDAANEMKIEKLPPLGAMIETPAAALCVDEITQFADFLSIGTNDLTQYTMAAGRENPLVSDYFKDDHPSIQKLLGIIIENAGSTKIALCGELAGNPHMIPALLKIGVRTFSVASPLVPQIKETIRQNTTS